MKRIYSHICRDATNTYFDPENLRNSKQPELGISDKPSYGLWASPFNDKNACEWEWFLSTELNKNSRKQERALEDIESARFDMFLHSKGITNNQYYDLPRNEFNKINNEYNALPPAYTKEEMAKAKEEDRRNRLEYGVDKRNCAFYFQVDQDKILHVHNLSDINPYMHYHKDYCIWRIDFDRIKEDGYDGVELHSATKMRNTVFWSWDVDSIVVWNPDCITPVAPHIAYLARFSAGVQNEFDKLDPNMDGIRIVNRILANEDITQSAIDSGVISFKDVEHAIGRVYDLEAIYRGDTGPCLTKEYEHRANKEEREFEEIER